MMTFETSQVQGLDHIKEKLAVGLILLPECVIDV